MTAPMRLALIDDHGLCRKGLAELLWHRAGIKVVGATGERPDAAASAVIAFLEREGYLDR